MAEAKTSAAGDGKAGTPLHRYRSHTCGALRPADIGATARLSGWVHRVRDHGGVLFIDLRDHYGLTQVVADPDSAAFKTAEAVRSEWVIRVDGLVRQRAARPQKIGLEDVIWSIASERLTGDTAGYGQVVPLHHPAHDALRVMWHAPVGPVTAPLVPVFMGMNEVPLEYGPHRYLTTGESARFLDARHAERGRDVVSRVPQGAEVTQSAFALHKRLMHLAFQMQDPLLPEIFDHWRRLERELAADLPDVLRSAEILLDQGEERLARRLLSQQAASWLGQALNEAACLADAAEKRLRNHRALNMSPVPLKPRQIW